MPSNTLTLQTPFASQGEMAEKYKVWLKLDPKIGWHCVVCIKFS